MKNRIHRKPNFRGRGFTIMELLIASVLAAILMIGILFATTQLARQVQRQKHLPSPTQFNPVIERLRKDISQATECRVTENQIHLRGFMWLDSQSQMQTGQPAQVIYELVQINDANWLIRYQRQLSNLTLDDSDANLLCKGIITMQLLALSSPPEDTPEVTPENIPEVTDPASSDIASEAQKSLNNKPVNPPATQMDKEKNDTPFAFTDQWQLLPPVVQWVITQDKITDESTEENILTFTLVRQ